MRRRDFLTALSASLVLLPNSAMAADSTSPLKRPKLVWLVLRGAMDSLHTVVPTFDRHLSTLRPTLAASINSDLLMLDKGYGLHPSLTNLHQWYKHKQLLPIVAVSSGYAARSHFDGQDFLESGLPRIDHDSGWLARSLQAKHKQALALARSTPISLRSAEAVKTWYPSHLKDVNEDIYERLAVMYQNDELLSQRLAAGLAVEQMAGATSAKSRRQGQFLELSKACARLMRGDNGVDCAMLEFGGWDTHNNQAIRLSRQLSQLDQGLQNLKLGLGEHWPNTVVIVASEFGRTAKENGTKGTDHGTAGAMFLAGGAINGGRVLGDWPGLAKKQLFEGRDLQPTSNAFSWIATVLAQHWGLTDAQLADVFPGINGIKQQQLLKSA